MSKKRTLQLPKKSRCMQKKALERLLFANLYFSTQGYWNAWSNASDMVWLLGRLGYICDSREDYAWLVMLDTEYDLWGPVGLDEVIEGHAGFSSTLKNIVERNINPTDSTRPEEWHIACFWSDFFQGNRAGADLCAEIRKRFPKVPKELSL